MKITQIVKFKEPVFCKRDDVEGVTMCDHSSPKKQNGMPCRMCLGRNRRNKNIEEEYLVDEFGRRITVISPEEWQNKKGNS